MEEFVSSLGGERVQSHLRVVGLAAPPVLVLRAIVDQQQEPGGGQALDEAVEACLRLGIDPVQVFEDDEQWLPLARPQQKPLERLQGALAALWGVEPLPVGLVHRHVQQRQERRQDRLQGLVEPHHGAQDFLTPARGIVAGVDAAVVFEQVDDREIRGGLAIREGAALQHQPSLRPRCVEALLDQAGLAHPRLAHHRHQLAMAAPGPFQGLVQLG